MQFHEWDNDLQELVNTDHSLPKSVRMDNNTNTVPPRGGKMEARMARFKDRNIQLIPTTSVETT